MPIDYNCDPCTDKKCEDLMLTDDKLYKRFLIRILCAIKNLVGGGGGGGAYALETTLQTVNAKIAHCDTDAVIISAMPPVIATVVGAGDASAANQLTEIASLASIDGKITSCNTGAVTVAASALPSGASTSALQTTGNNSLSSIDGKITTCNTGAIAGSVSVTNAGAGAAVNIQDGGNSITVDGSVAVSSMPALVPGTPTSLTASAPAQVSVGVTSTVVIAANANRKGLVITNTSDDLLFFAVGAPAVYSRGIHLAPNGVWEMDNFTFTTGEIRGISNNAGSNVAIQEFV